jgi:sugar phosphate isomerase/epimerase
MRLGINEYPLTQVLGFESALETIRSIGFTHIDFAFYERNALFEGEDYRDVAQAMRQRCDAQGLKVHQMHANWFKNDDPEAEKAYKIAQNERAFEVAEILGCPYLVFHATKFRGYYRSPLVQARANAYNLELFNHYLHFAKRTQVKLAIENMFGYITNTTQPADTIFAGAGQMNEYMDRLGAHCVACLDTGHAYIAQQDLPDMVHALGDRLRVLHVHDAIMTEDAHLVPGLGLIEWPAFFNALRAINFDGVVSLEILPQNSVGVVEYARYAYRVIEAYTEQF